MSDEQLIKDIISGNQAAFKNLMEKYQLQVFRTVMGFVHTKEDAEEVTQDIFVRVYQSISSFHHDAEFSTWLYRITVNTSLNFLRGNRKTDCCNPSKPSSLTAVKRKPRWRRWSKQNATDVSGWRLTHSPRNSGWPLS